MCDALHPSLQLRNPLWQEGGVNYLGIWPGILRKFHDLLRHPVQEEYQGFSSDIRCSGGLNTVRCSSEMAPKGELEGLAELNQHTVRGEGHLHNPPVRGVLDVESTVRGGEYLVTFQIEVERAGEDGDTPVVQVPPTQPILKLAGCWRSRKVVEESTLTGCHPSLQHLKKVPCRVCPASDPVQVPIKQLAHHVSHPQLYLCHVLEGGLQFWQVLCRPDVVSVQLRKRFLEVRVLCYDVTERVGVVGALSCVRNSVSHLLLAVTPAKTVGMSNLSTCRCRGKQNKKCLMLNFDKAVVNLFVNWQNNRLVQENELLSAKPYLDSK